MYRAIVTFKQRVTLTIMVAVMLLPGSGLVQCIGNNGHTAVELPHPTGCDEGVSGQLVSVDQTTSASSDADCTDVALASAAVIRHDPQSEQLVEMFLMPPLLYTIPLADLLPSHLSFDRYASDDLASAEHDQLLRSTVLLI